jgi:galactokinase/mevalonate kinase-like predicted kinase
MATSTRAKAIELWQTDIPEGNKEKLAHTLFCVENPPGTKCVSGSQDSIGIVFPGVNKLDYPSDSYWPEKITSITDDETLSWIEGHLWFINLSPREKCFDVLSNTKIDETGAKALADASYGVWQAILDKDLLQFAYYFKASFEAQIAMFPHMVTPQITEAIRKYEKQVPGWKISGAGGGGYLVLVSEEPVANAMQVKIRR